MTRLCLTVSSKLRETLLDEVVEVKAPLPVFSLAWPHPHAKADGFGDYQLMRNEIIKRLQCSGRINDWPIILPLAAQ